MVTLEYFRLRKLYGWKTLGYKRLQQKPEGSFKSPLKRAKRRTVNKFHCYVRQEVSIQGLNFLKAFVFYLRKNKILGQDFCFCNRSVMTTSLFLNTALPSLLWCPSPWSPGYFGNGMQTLELRWWHGALPL